MSTRLRPTLVSLGHASSAAAPAIWHATAPAWMTITRGAITVVTVIVELHGGVAVIGAGVVSARAIAMIPVQTTGEVTARATTTSTSTEDVRGSLATPRPGLPSRLRSVPSSTTPAPTATPAPAEVAANTTARLKTIAAGPSGGGCTGTRSRGAGRPATEPLKHLQLPGDVLV